MRSTPIAYSDVSDPGSTDGGTPNAQSPAATRADPEKGIAEFGWIADILAGETKSQGPGEQYSDDAVDIDSMAKLSPKNREIVTTLLEKRQFCQQLLKAQTLSTCKACDATGFASDGWQCEPCRGTGAVTSDAILHENPDDVVTHERPRKRQKVRSCLVTPETEPRSLIENEVSFADDNDGFADASAVRLEAVKTFEQNPEEQRYVDSLGEYGIDSNVQEYNSLELYKLGLMEAVMQRYRLPTNDEWKAQQDRLSQYYRPHSGTEASTEDSPDEISKSPRTAR